MPIHFNIEMSIKFGFLKSLKIFTLPTHRYSCDRIGMILFNGGNIYVNSNHGWSWLYRVTHLG